MGRGRYQKRVWPAGQIFNHRFAFMLSGASLRCVSSRQWRQCGGQDNGLRPPDELSIAGIAGRTGSGSWRRVWPSRPSSTPVLLAFILETRGSLLAAGGRVALSEPQQPPPNPGRWAVPAVSGPTQSDTPVELSAASRFLRCRSARPGSVCFLRVRATLASPEALRQRCGTLPPAVLTPSVPPHAKALQGSRPEPAGP